MALEQSVIKVKHAKADDIRKSVEKLLTDRGKIAVDERTNSLVVTDIPSKLPLVEETVNTLDTQTPQITIETKLVEMNSRALREMGIDWTAMTRPRRCASGSRLSRAERSRSTLQDRAWGQTRFPFRFRAGISSPRSS